MISDPDVKVSKGSDRRHIQSHLPIRTTHSVSPYIISLLQNLPSGWYKLIVPFYTAVTQEREFSWIITGNSALCEVSAS